MTQREQELYLMRQYLRIDLDNLTSHMNVNNQTDIRAGLFNQGISRAKLQYLLDNEIIKFKGVE